MTIVEMCVHMDCAGCEKKIRKALQKIKGVDDVDIDMVTQKVTVTGWVDQKKALKAVRKTGRTAVLWPYLCSDVDYHNRSTRQYYDQCHQSHGQYHVAYGAHPYAHASTSSYNYRKHGYGDSCMHGYHQGQPYSTVGEKVGAFFSDDNPHACSIM